MDEKGDLMSPLIVIKFHGVNLRRLYWEEYVRRYEAIKWPGNTFKVELLR